VSHKEEEEEEEEEEESLQRGIVFICFSIKR
jgi:hypothetical protein